MSSDRKIILHIGLPKTGTSTIQNVFHANRDFLLQQESILYPSLAPSLNVPLGTIFKDAPGEHIVNKMASLTSEEITMRQKNYRSSLDSEISSGGWDILLLSAEGLSNMSASEMTKLREWGETYATNWTVLLCTRHAVDWARSVVQQLLKQGHTLQQLYENIPTPDYRRKISHAISVFGQENVRIYDFESAAKSDEGIVGAFAEQIGLTAASSEFLASRAVNVNESISLEAVQILDSLNRQRPLFVDGVRAPGRAGRELPYLRRIEGQKFDVPDSVKEEVRLRSRKDIAWLNETFGLDLYRDIVDYTPQEGNVEKSPQPVNDPTVDSIAEVIGDLVAETAFQRLLNRGKAALSRGNLKRAAEAFREASRLDPDAPQPKRLLKQVAAKQPRNSAYAPPSGTNRS